VPWALRCVRTSSGQMDNMPYWQARISRARRVIGSSWVACICSMNRGLKPASAPRLRHSGPTVTRCEWVASLWALVNPQGPLDKPLEYLQRCESASIPLTSMRGKTLLRLSIPAYADNDKVMIT